MACRGAGSSSEKSRFDFRRGNHTRVGPAEPAIAVPRYCRINPVSRHSGNEPEDRDELPKDLGSEQKIWGQSTFSSVTISNSRDVVLPGYGL